MISRYSKVSRVTIHKQFSSKEVLFRAFIKNFLIDKDGIVQTAYYGKDEGDHLDFEKIKAFQNNKFPITS